MRRPKRSQQPGSGHLEDGLVSQPEENSRWLSGVPLWSLTFALCLSSSIITLYVSIIATAIPSITAEFDTISDLDWYSNGYLLTLCTTLPLAGNVYDHFQLKQTYLTYIALFEVGNLVCALAPTSASFIVGRAIAGLGAAGLAPGSNTMFSAAAHPRIRPILMAMGMAMTSIGGVVGPVLGGAITQHIGWRWCFWIFLPFGAICAFIFIFLKVPEQREKLPLLVVLPDLHHKIDVVGLVLFLPACVMILLAISWGGQRYAWNSATVIGLLCGGVVTAAVFIVWQHRRQDRALIPPSMMKKQVVFFGCLVSFLQGGAFLDMGYYLPLWFQSIKQATPTNSGVMLLPTMVAQIISSLGSGVLISKLLYVTPWAILGSIFSAVGCGLMTTFNVGTTEGQWIGYQVIVGFGRGFVLQMPIIAIQGALNGEEISVGTGMIQFTMYLGAVLFLSISKSVFEDGLAPALAEYAPNVDAQQIIGAGSTQILDGIPPSEAAGVLEAYNKALVATFWLPVAAGILAFAFSFGLGWQKIVPKTMMRIESKEEQGIQMTERAAAPLGEDPTARSNISKNNDVAMVPAKTTP